MRQSRAGQNIYFLTNQGGFLAASFLALMAVQYCMFSLGENMVPAVKVEAIGEKKSNNKNHILQLFLKVCGMVGRNIHF